ncbi:MAG: YmdB family metallophosphoesterase [Ureaplasma sp.]|nr:YmdB family metallophosphoesterase [Ureaplasma sp.]MDE6289139.1 YmdB family metallophosphoesterase [Ureaplasma sp.]
MRIMCIGDIFARTGRRALKTELKSLREQYNVDYVIANAENATHCKGLTIKHYNDLMSYGIDFFTMGNHTWNKEDVYELLKTKFNIIRPYNIKFDSNYSMYGVGSRIVNFKGIKIRITNLLGESVMFHNNQYSPFKAMDEILKYGEESDLHIVDFHAETTSEKNAFFCLYQSKISLIYGTHTHVQTADERIREGTAFITDVGMTGPSDGVIGAKIVNMIDKFRNDEGKFILEEQEGKYQFCAIIVDFDLYTKKPINIQRIYKYE